MKVFLDSVGCRLNQSEIERMASQFRQVGHTLVASPSESDLVVINTCTVTHAAAADSRARARQAHRSNPRSQVILTGCWSDLERAQAYDLPGVAQVVPNAEKDLLVARLLGLPEETFDREPIERRPVPGLRMRTRAFIKVQDGCDNHCTFCLTTIARGPARSVPLERVVAEVRAAVAGGAQEAVLTGVQLSAYGRDLGGRMDLVGLVGAVLKGTDIPRLRLSSLEPWGLPEGFFDLWENPRLCRQLHLPLQSGSAATLRRMGRPLQPDAYRRLVAEARSTVPGLAVTTDVIVGFPGETQEAFSESLSFIEAMDFAGAHVFVYSPRPGTAASRLPGRVPTYVARERSRCIRQAVERSARAFRARFVGRTVTVLWESATALGPQGWALSGLTDNNLRVKAWGEGSLWNRLCRVRLTGLDGEALRGELIQA